MTDCGWFARPHRATYHTTTTTTRCSVHAIQEEYGHVQLTKTSDAQILFHPHCHPPSQPHRDPLQRPPLNIDLNPHTERQSSRSSGWGRHEGDTNKWWPVLCQINPRPVCLILWVSPSLSVHTSEVGLGQIVLVAFISQPNHTRHQLSPPVVPTIPLPQSTYY